MSDDELRHLLDSAAAAPRRAVDVPAVRSRARTRARRRGVAVATGVAAVPLALVAVVTAVEPRPEPAQPRPTPSPSSAGDLWSAGAVRVAVTDDAAQVVTVAQQRVFLLRDRTGWRALDGSTAVAVESGRPTLVEVAVTWCASYRQFEALLTRPLRWDERGQNQLPMRERLVRPVPGDPSSVEVTLATRDARTRPKGALSSHPCPGPTLAAYDESLPRTTVSRLRGHSPGAYVLRDARLEIDGTSEGVRDTTAARQVADSGVHWTDLVNSYAVTGDLVAVVDGRDVRVVVLPGARVLRGNTGVRLVAGVVREWEPPTLVLDTVAAPQFGIRENGMPGPSPSPLRDSEWLFDGNDTVTTYRVASSASFVGVEPKTLAPDAVVVLLLDARGVVLRVTPAPTS